MAAGDAASGVDAAGVAVDMVDDGRGDHDGDERGSAQGQGHEDDGGNCALGSRTRLACLSVIRRASHAAMHEQHDSPA